MNRRSLGVGPNVVYGQPLSLGPCRAAVGRYAYCTFEFYIANQAAISTAIIVAARTSTIYWRERSTRGQ